MEFAETRDPLGFVGARVMRHSRKARRRRQRATPPTPSFAMKPDPGAVRDDTANDADADEPDMPPALVLYGWLTRYDTRLDAYTLFLPDGGGATLCPRGDVLQFVANPEFQLRTDGDEAYPPPVEDSTSRFVGAPMFKKRMNGVKASAIKKRARRAASVGEEDEDETVAGRVVCYRPFADVYRVAYEDGTTVDVSESDVVDALLAFAKRMQQERQKQRQQEEDEAKKTVPATRKRRRSEELTTGDRREDDDDDEETEDEALQLDGVKAEREEDRAGRQTTEPHASPRDQAATSGASAPSISIPVPTPETLAAPTAKQSELAVPSPADPEPEFDFAHPDDDEPMELLPLDDDDDDRDHDMNRINAALASIQTTTPTATPTVKTETRPPRNAEIVEILDDDDDDDSVAVKPPSPVTSAVTGPRPIYYVVHVKPRTIPQPLDKRSMAFEFLRAELTKLLDAEECAKLEISLVSDVMTNRDIKDRDAVRRFVETGGLVVINCVLNARARDALARHETRYDRVLFVLKLLAMLPTPSEQQVMESSIGKTIGRLIKSRMHDQQAAADAAMPKCIAHMAKWIKQKWIANMKREKTTPAAAASAKAKKHLQRPTLGRPSGQRASDPEPIPRRPQTSTPSRPPQIPSFAASSERTASAPSTDVLGRALSSGSSSPRWQQPQRSSLKPDWIRQKELLARTRFTINTDANAERQHYQRDRRNAVASASEGARTPGQANSNARTTDDAGARGVYGRSQRLSFGPRWNVCEFFKDTPPSAVRRANAKSTGSYSHRFGRPKPILRKKSKYRDDLTF